MDMDILRFSYHSAECVKNNVSGEGMVPYLITSIPMMCEVDLDDRGPNGSSQHDIKISRFCAVLGVVSHFLSNNFDIVVMFAGVGVCKVE